MSRRDAHRLAVLLEDSREVSEASEAEQELAGLASLARALEASGTEPTPSFPAALRTRVLAALDAEPSSRRPRARLPVALGQAFVAWRSSASSMIASGTLTVLVLLAGLFVGANLSLPGDPLYAIKDAYQQNQLSRASAPADTASMQLRMAGAKIDDALRAAERGRDGSVETAARDATELAADGAGALLTIYRDTGDQSMLAHLGLFVRHYEPAVHDLGQQVSDPDAQAAVARLRATLDDIDIQFRAVLDGCCAIDATEATAWWLRPSDAEDSSPPGGAEASPAHDRAAGSDERDGDRGTEPTEGSEPTPAPDPRARGRQAREELRDGTRQALDNLSDGLREGVRTTVGESGLRDVVEGAGEGVRDTVDDLVEPDAASGRERVDGLRDSLEGVGDELNAPQADERDGDEADERDGDGADPADADGDDDERDGLLP